jgi:hypothetical protein
LESSFHGLTHVFDLPRNLGSTSATRSGQLGRFSCVGGSAEGVGPHVCDTRSLAGCPSCCLACLGNSSLSRATRDKPATNLARCIQLAAGEGPGTGNSVPCSIVAWRFLLE